VDNLPSPLRAWYLDLPSAGIAKGGSPTVAPLGERRLVEAAGVEPENDALVMRLKWVADMGLKRGSLREPNYNPLRSLSMLFS